MWLWVQNGCHQNRTLVNGKDYNLRSISWLNFDPYPSRVRFWQSQVKGVGPLNSESRGSCGPDGTVGSKPRAAQLPDLKISNGMLLLDLGVLFLRAPQNGLLVSLSNNPKIRPSTRPRLARKHHSPVIIPAQVFCSMCNLSATNSHQLQQEEHFTFEGASSTLQEEERFIFACCSRPPAPDHVLLFLRLAAISPSSHGRP